MKALKRKQAVAAAKVVKKLAEAGSGLASIIGLYQPKVPAKLTQ